MKTTIDISNALFNEAKRYSAFKKITFKEVFETALRKFLDSDWRKTRNFKYKKHTFSGKGLQAGLQEGDWAEIRKRAYQGHGG